MGSGKTIFTIEVNTAQAEAAMRELKRTADSLGASLNKATSGGATGAIAGGTADQAAKSYARLSAQFPSLVKGLEQQAKLQGGEVIRSTVRLSTTTDQLTGRMVNHLSAQTQLDNGMRGHVSTLDRASTGLSRYTSLLSKMAVSMIVWEGFRMVTEQISQVIQKEQEYSLETARFAAITDQSVSQAEASWNKFADIGISQGVKPSEMGGTMRTAQLAQGTDDEKRQYVEVVTKLQAVTGEQADTISKSVYSVLQQAGMNLGEVGKIGDQVIATLQKMPNIKIENVFSAMQEAPALAKLWGTSFENAFNIIVQGAARAQESPEQMATSFQRLSTGINDLSMGGANAYERISKLKEVFKFDVAPGANILETLKSAAVKLPTIPAAQQQEFLEALSGGSIRPEQMRNIIGGIDAFNVDLKKSMDGVAGSLNDAATKVEASWGQLNAKMEAGLEKLKMTGDIGQNLGAGILSGTVGKMGVQGTEFVNNYVNTQNMTNAFGREGAVQANKDQFIRSLTGMTPDEAREAINQYNDTLGKAFVAAVRLDPTKIGSLKDTLQAGLVGDTEVQTIMAEAGKLAGENFVRGMQSSLSNIGSFISSALGGKGMSEIQDQVNNLFGALTGKKPESSAAATTPAARVAPPRRFPGGILGKLGQEESITAFRRDAAGSMTGLTGESILNRAGQVDLTKNTQDEINQAKKLAIELSKQDIAAQREFYQAIGLEPAEIEKIIAARQEEIDATITLVKTQQGLNYEVGAQGKYLQEAMRQQENLKKLQKEENNFQFKRLKDVDPSQFGQLQALTQMYDQMLTNMGSPEKKSDINLLLGQQNVYKTMNARMTALQLALEDLTKVEKAQLAGTWNLPSGATALVPIQSLDIQRWNKSGGGGLSEEAIRNLMNAFNTGQQPVTDATKTSGIIVKSSVDLARDAIVGAIVQNSVKGASRGEDKPLTSIIKDALGVKEVSTDKERERQTSRVPIPPRRMSGEVTGDTDAPDLYPQGKAMAEALPDLVNMLSRPLNVTVGAMPLKANFNANLTVLMDGHTIAKAIFPILYQMLVKMSSATPSTGGSVGTIRS